LQKFPTFRTNELPPFTTSDNKTHKRCPQLILKSRRLSSEKEINRFHRTYVALFTETHQQTLTPSVQCVTHFYPSFHPEASSMLSFHQRNYLPHGLHSRCSTTKILCSLYPCLLHVAFTLVIVFTTAMSEEDTRNCRRSRNLHLPRAYWFPQAQTSSLH
jgi:hypothetical protein